MADDAGLDVDMGEDQPEHPDAPVQSSFATKETRHVISFRLFECWSGCPSHHIIMRGGCVIASNLKIRIGLL